MPQEIPASQKPAQATATEQTAASPSPSRPVINASDLSGLKYFKRIRPLLESLHEVGAERDRAQNRELHMDQYACLVLMWLFNQIPAHVRTGKGGANSDGKLRTVTDVMDVPAELIAEAYRLRT